MTYHEFHETCHSVTFIILVNLHQRWKHTRNCLCFHLWCELTLALWCQCRLKSFFMKWNVTEWQVPLNSWTALIPWCPLDVCRALDRLDIFECSSKVNKASGDYTWFSANHTAKLGKRIPKMLTGTMIMAFTFSQPDSQTPCLWDCECVPNVETVKSVN